MKKLLFAVGVAVIALVACNKQNEKSDTVDAQATAMLEERLSLAQDSKDSLIFLMSDIYTGIEEINAQEGMLYNLRGTENDAQREEIMSNLSRIKQELADRQARLDALTQQFNTTNDKNGELAKQVKKLKALIAEKETRIGELEQQLQSANTQISNLKDTVAETRKQVSDVTAEKELAQKQVEEQTQVNEQLVKEANTVYYAIGTKKELEKNNIYKKKKAVYNDLTYFTKADKRTLTSIPCNNKKVEIVSGQSPSSYRIEGEKKGPKTIVITNPDVFWANKYLIIKID